jgi:hypothetical protein
MPITLEETDQVTSPGTASTTAPDAPIPQSQDGLWTPEPGGIPAKGMAALKLLSHNATMGMDSKLMGILGGEETEKRSLENVDAAREELGLAALPIEIYGAVKSPVLKGLGMVGKALGFGKVAAPIAEGASKVFDTLAGTSKAAGIAKSALGGAVKGAGIGGLASTISYAGEHPTRELNTDDALEAAKSGGMLGGAIGGIGGGLLGYLGPKKSNFQVKALGSTAGDIAKPGKLSLLSEDKGLDKVRKVAALAEEKGGTGGFMQDAETTLAKVKNSVSEVGKEGELIREKIINKALQGNNPIVGNAKDIVEEVMQAARQKLSKNMALTQTHLDGLTSMRREVARTLGLTKKLNPDLTINDLHRSYSGIKNIVRGKGGDKVPSEIGQYVQGAIKDVFRNRANAIDPDLAKKLAQADKDYHYMLLAKNMAARGARGELGQRAGGGMLGTVRGGAAALLSHYAGAPGRVAAYMIGNKAGQRSVLPNTALSILKNAKKLNTATRLAGTAVGKNSSQSQ